MPTWAISAGSRSRPPGSASCCRRSPSTISARARCCSPIPRSSRTRSSCSIPDWALLPMVGARDGGDHHRQPGGDHRRLLADPAGDPARPPAAHGDPPHLGDREGPDLHPARQLASARRRGLSSSIVFRSSSALAAAYGIAVTGTMVDHDRAWPSSWCGNAGTGARRPRPS